MESQSNCLFITYVEKEGPFLKVWGQTDKNTSLYIEQVLNTFSSQFDNGLCIPHPESLQIGILCCAKYKDNKYYRARITSLDFLQNKYIEINFVDYGHKDVVPVTNIRSLEGFDNSFISLPPQAASFLLAEAVCPRGEWNEAYLEQICKEVRYSEVNFSIVAQVTKHYLVRLFVGVNDLAILLISKGLMRHTSLTTQEAVLLAMMPRTSVQQSAPQQSIATYKAYSLEPGSQYEVYVSYVTDGPCNFSVQLKQSEEVLSKLMKEINSMNLTPIDGIPIPGTVCLARCMEDGHICRAVVTNEVDGQYKVFYVDFGNFEVVPLESIYEVPFKYVIPKAMAIRFALASVEKSTVTLEMQCAFKQFVDNRLMHMKVMPMTARISLPRCELWDPESKVSALDIVNQAASVAYPEHVSLNRGFSQQVKVSYVFSCSRFYVQLKSKQDELLRLMLDIQAVCRRLEPLKSNVIKVGLPCYALFEADQQWYRSQVVEVLGGGQAKVQYVDYGNEEVVPISVLKPIEGRQLTVLRPQAIECCLNGYQNMEADIERDNLLEELILEQEFTMKVVEMQGKKALIELIDSSNYNVASLLLDKIAITRSQVSPMLVQAGNKIEHRKTSSPQQPFGRQEQRKPERALKQSVWGELQNGNSTWRQNNGGARNRNSYESNEINENSNWKQNNRGFNKSFDRNNKRDDLSDSNESDRQSNKSFKNIDRIRNDLNSRNADGNSWRQNNKGFNKNQDRFNRDNNRNDWGANGDDNKRDKDDWGASKENNRRNFRQKEESGEDRENDRRSFKPRESRDNWNNNKENERRGGYNNARGEENNWGDSRQKKEQDNWGGDSGHKTEDSWGDNKKQDTWGDSGHKKEKDSWGGGNRRDDRKGFGGNRDRDNFRKDRDRSNEEKGDWGTSESSHKPGGFRKKPDFKRETSELSSSGSEKSFRKGGYRDNRNKQKSDFGKKFDRTPKFGDDSGDTWNVSTSTAVEVPNAAPPTAKFEILEVNGTEANVVISWFHNPARFYCQIENTQEEFKKMMQNIQEAYKDRPSSTAVVGAPVIGLFPEDGVLYRAQVLEILGSQYKIYYVDFGNVSTINKVWPIEMRFMELPAQAICCKLDQIESLSDTWPDASNFSNYFNKKQFLCRFISTENNIVSVRLEYKGEDIASSLIRDGLAKAPITPPPVEIALLIGQQFRAMLLSVNSLGDFSMCLQSGVLLNCGIFNLAESTETWEQNLKDQLEQILIVYVDDLKDDKLEVTLYDQTGAKIKLIDRDQEAFETVELLCPYLLLYSSLSGEIAHVDDKTIFIQPSDCAAIMEYLLNTMFDVYEAITLENPIVPVEGYVYAVKGSDSNWYRGRVVNFDDSKAEINYIDYGNSESVEFGALRELTADFMECQIMAVAVSVNVPTENLIGQSVTVDLVFTEAGLEGTIREEQPIEPPVQAEEVVPPQETVAEVAPELIGTEVVLSHADSPSDFYLHLADSIAAIEELQASLQEKANEMADMENPVVGVLCAAPYSLDQQWYRALILDADSDITTVRFVDYGNTDVLDNSTTRVKTLPSNLLALEVHATRCRLKIKPVEDEWSSAASERFNELCCIEPLTAQFISQDEKANYVELYSNGTSIAQTLIQENLALPDAEIAPETKSVGFVSHLNSPSEFWIQLENCVEELEWVAEQLSGAENFKELEDLAPGTLCAALFPDDQMWYRARILSNTVAGIEVLFVDYGNSCTSCSLRELPEDLVMLPPLAQKCSLQKPDGLTSWGPEMIKRFAEISADGQTTFEIKKLSTGETASVELLLDGVDVTQMLLPKTEDVKVKSFDSFDEILLLNRNDEELGKFVLEPLPDVIWNEESSRKFADIVEEGIVFQADFVDDTVVRLYIGLNDIRLDLSGTKTPMSSPLKSRSDIVHSIKDNEINEDIQSIVTEIIDSCMENTSEEVAETVDQSEDAESPELVEDAIRTVGDPIVDSPKKSEPFETSSEGVSPKKMEGSEPVSPKMVESYEIASEAESPEKIKSSEITIEATSPKKGDSSCEGDTPKKLEVCEPRSPKKEELSEAESPKKCGLSEEDSPKTLETSEPGSPQKDESPKKCDSSKASSEGDSPKKLAVSEPESPKKDELSEAESLKKCDLSEEDSPKTLETSEPGSPQKDESPKKCDSSKASSEGDSPKKLAVSEQGSPKKDEPSAGESPKKSDCSEASIEGDSPKKLETPEPGSPKKADLSDCDSPKKGDSCEEDSPKKIHSPSLESPDKVSDAESHSSEKIDVPASQEASPNDTVEDESLETSVTSPKRESPASDEKDELSSDSPKTSPKKEGSDKLSSPDGSPKKVDPKDCSESMDHENPQDE